jgi:3-oxo-4-pregnene-20-carboxyl-CoA dehydrogenase beta subunit
MYLDLTDAQRALRDELRAYFGALISPAEREVMLMQRHGSVYRELVRRMGRDGWLGIGWPVRYGGRGLGQIEQHIFVTEAGLADVPLPAVTLQTVGPTLMAHGTPEQKDFFLPKILSGELHFAIGYTEPGAGTDLASLATRAVRDGDDYVVNGQKIFTTGGHDADYVWLACRTDPAAVRHRGLSILIVDTSDPGYSWTPIITHDGSHHVNATYYSDVRVPAGMRVGAENAGWRLITEQLNHERVMLGPSGRIGVLRRRVHDWAAGQRGPTGRALLAEPDVGRALARASAAERISELLNWQVAATAGGAGGSSPLASTAGGAGGSSPLASTAVDVADASVTKVFGSEHVQRIGAELAQVVARHGDQADEETAELARWLDVQNKRNTVMTFGGGVNEVQRELIATAGLKLPRVPR